MIETSADDAKMTQTASSEDRQPPAVEASALMAGRREVVILHRGERYRLRVTQSNKLILTK